MLPTCLVLASGKREGANWQEIEACRASRIHVEKQGKAAQEMKMR